MKPKKEMFKPPTIGEKQLTCNKCESVAEEDPYQSILEIEVAKKKEEPLSTALKVNIR